MLTVTQSVLVLDLRNTGLHCCCRMDDVSVGLAGLRLVHHVRFMFGLVRMRILNIGLAG